MGHPLANRLECKGWHNCRHEVYSQAPLRLISWCSFELRKTAKKLLCELAEMCELSGTTTQALVTHIAVRNSEVKTEQEATQYSALLATVHHLVKDQIAQLYHHGSTFPWHLAIAHGCLHVRLLFAHAQPNEGYNETGLTMQRAGPIRQPWRPVTFEFLFQRREFGHWKVKGGPVAWLKPLAQVFGSSHQ